MNLYKAVRTLYEGISVGILVFFQYLKLYGLVP